MKGLKYKRKSKNAPRDFKQGGGARCTKMHVTHLFFFFLVFGMSFYGFSFFHHLFIFIF